MRARTKLEAFVKQASASETKVNIITTIDHNRASGISRISREIMADIIVLGWPHRAGLIDKLIGEKVDSILNNTDKTTFICHFEKPLVLHKRVAMIIPPLAEHENGFEQWFTKMSKLAQELSIPILLCCNETTQNSVNKLMKKAKLTASIVYHFFEEWDDFFILSKAFNHDDLLVLVCARKGAASHMNVLENLPSKLEKHFEKNSRIIIYPQQYNQFYGTERYDDITPEPLRKGIEAAQKIGRGIGNIFKKDNLEESI